MNNYVIKVNEKDFFIEKSDSDALDITKTDSSNFHLLKNNKAYNVKLMHSDLFNKTLTLSVNGNIYNIKIEDAYDQQVDKMGLLTVVSQKINSIEAPMPGLIMDILVEIGQEISEGTPLLVLSAMKMENILLSEGEGIVKSIHVKKDEAVEKGQLIIEME